MSDSGSDYELETKKKPTKKPAKKSKKPANVSDEDSDSGPDDRNQPAPKKQKTSNKKESSSGGVDKFETGPGGERLYPLGRMRYVSIGAFKGKKNVNIREYYVDKNDDKMKPGKKGICLSLEEWSKIKDLAPTLDEEI